MIRRCAIAAAILLAAGCYDAPYGEPDEGAQPPRHTETIATLRKRYPGKTLLLEGDIIVEGIVTSSDEGRNFYRSFCIEEEGAGIEIMAGIDQLHNDYPVGCRVSLSLKGMALGESRGVLQIGRMPAPESGYATDYIGSKPALDRIVTRHGETLLPTEPAAYEIRNLTTEQCGTLVRIGPVLYRPEELSEATWAGYKRFVDEKGAEIYTYVRNYARFAEEEVPFEPVMLAGILQYDETGEGRYIIKLRDEKDCRKIQ